MNSFSLSEAVKVQSGFGRSVNLERDFYAHVSLDGYILTATARQALARLGEGFTDSKARALTLTGLYGSGKSTFALFAAKLFSNESSSQKEAEELLKAKDFELWQKLFGNAKTLFDNDNDKVALDLFPILVSGSREPLAKAILRAVKKALQDSGSQRLQNLIAAVEQLDELDRVSGKQLLSLFSDVTKASTLR